MKRTRWVRQAYKNILAVTAVLVGLVAVQPAAAQQDTQNSPQQSALAVSPAIIEHVLTPGEPVQFSLEVANITNYPLPIKATVRDFAAQPQDMKQSDHTRLDASGWFTLSEPDFILQPKQTKTITGRITPPADAVPGGRYATIYFQPLVPEAVLTPATTYLSARVGVLAFLIVKGDIEYEAKYQEPLKTSGFVRKGPINFSFSIKNTGSVHIQPTGGITINGLGGKKATIPLPAGVILPGATKTYNLQWKNPGFIGKYTAELAVLYGDEQTPLQKSAVSFWVIPWVQLVLIAAMLAGTILLYAKTRRRWRKAWRALHE